VVAGGRVVVEEMLLMIAVSIQAIIDVCGVEVGRDPGLWWATQKLVAVSNTSDRGDDGS
jgi:hypothetical protein